MKQLLSYKSNRIISILEMLITHESSVHIDEIMKLNSCSLKTVYDDIHYIQERWSDVLDVSLENKKCTLLNLSMGDYHRIRQDVAENELTFELLLDIYFKPGASYLDYSLEMDVSETTLRATVEQLNRYLDRYGMNVRVSKKSGGLEVFGENDLAVMIMIREMIRFTGNDTYLHSVDIEDLDYVKAITAYYSDELPIYIYNDAILFYRIYITKTGLKDIAHDAIWVSFYQQNRVLSDRTHLAIELEAFTKLLEINISLKTTKEVLDILSFYTQKLRFLSYNTDNIYNRYHQFYRQFAADNLYEITLFNTFMIRLSQRMNIDFQEYETEILFSLYRYIYRIKHIKTLNVGIVSDLGIEHESTLVIRCQEYFPKLEFSSFTNSGQFDLILSTSHDCGKIDDTLPRVVISDYITTYDIHNISSSIQGIFKHLSKNHQGLGYQ